MLILSQNEKDEHISDHREEESVLPQSLFEDQQCQMECAGDMSDERDSFQEAVPVDVERFPASTYGERGNLDKSALLPSDAEQMLRVRKSMAHTGLLLSVSIFATESLSQEASVVPHCFFVR